MFNSSFFCWEVPFLFVYWPIREHNCLCFWMKCTEDFFCNKWHVWMKKSKCFCKYSLKSPKSCICRCWIFILLISTNFCNFDVPVTEFIPDEIVYFLYCDTKFIFIHIFCCIFCKCIYF